MPLDYGPDHLANYEVGIKSQWFDNRLQLNVSAFLMEWDDIQIHSPARTATTNGAFWIEGNINGGKAEQKGVEFNGQWYATDRLSFEWSAFLASPEFTEDTFVPNTDEVYIAKGTTMPVSPKEKYWAAVEYTFPDFLPLQGDFWTRFSYTWQGKVWDSLTAIEDFHSDDAEDPEKPRVPDPAMEVRHVPGRLHQRQRLGRGAHRPQCLRRRRLQLPEQHLVRRAIFGDPRWRYIRDLQRPRSYYLSFTKKW